VFYNRVQTRFQQNRLEWLSRLIFDALVLIRVFLAHLPPSLIQADIRTHYSLSSMMMGRGKIGG
jgi:hypothetical protein